MKISNRSNTAIYWVSTAILLIPMAISGVLEILGKDPVTAEIVLLGYPLYFSKLLGVAKLLGTAAILWNRWRTLKEWAYAGMTFDLIGAVISHFAVGQPMKEAASATVILVACLTSYFAWRRFTDITMSARV